ncbi:hypothetical protein HMPREF9137_0092 [Prevotella denticola F0289]|nr:hypothetical protein HMPREF9137_0092 [Prevotella denticola F0289]
MGTQSGKIQAGCRERQPKGSSDITESCHRTVRQRTGMVVRRQSPDTVKHTCRNIPDANTPHRTQETRLSRSADRR